MARSRGARSVGPAVRPFVLDDATPASPPTTPSATIDPTLTDSPRAKLDERVQRWLKERERYERRRGSPAGSDATGPTSK